MSSDNCEFPISDHLPLLSIALSMACNLCGETIDPKIRVALGYFILVGARSGERSASRLARYAVERLRSEPRIVDVFDEEW